jgi:hypothetical protein
VMQVNSVCDRASLDLTRGDEIPMELDRPAIELEPESRTRFLLILINRLCSINRTERSDEMSLKDQIAINRATFEAMLVLDAVALQATTAADGNTSSEQWWTEVATRLSVALKGSGHFRDRLTNDLNWCIESASRAF